MLTDPPSSYEFIFFNKWKKTKFFHAIAYISNFSYGFVMLDQSFVYPMFLVKALLRYSSSRMAGTILLFLFFFKLPSADSKYYHFTTVSLSSVLLGAVFADLPLFFLGPGLHLTLLPEFMKLFKTLLTEPSSAVNDSRINVEFVFLTVHCTVQKQERKKS